MKRNPLFDCFQHAFYDRRRENERNQRQTVLAIFAERFRTILWWATFYRLFAFGLEGVARSFYTLFPSREFSTKINRKRRLLYGRAKFILRFYLLVLLCA